MKIKICDLSPERACSFYRGYGAFKKLEELDSSIHVELITGKFKDISWVTFYDCDILIFLRPIHAEHIEVIRKAQDFNVPVWVDFDDNLHELPADNPFKIGLEIRNSYEIMKDCVATAIKYADIVTVSTNSLKEYYLYLNPNIVVIENAFNDYKYKLELKQNENEIITWRGSITHESDLKSCKEDMINVAHRNNNWEWVFIGDNIYYITEHIQNSKSTYPEMGLIEYNKYIHTLSPSIHLVPLVDNIFNTGKSNCSWIEGTYAGAACICPELPEFIKPGIINYKDNFMYLLNKLVNNKSFRKESYKESFYYIKENLLLSKINKKRLEIVKRTI